jgi:hypothetical protein
MCGTPLSDEIFRNEMHEGQCLQNNLQALIEIEFAER